MAEKRKDSNVEFVKAMGSPTGLYGPLPEDDWVYRMKYADAEESAMGWLHAHTIDIDHHALYAQDEHGRALGAKALAAYQGWDVDTAEKILLRLEKAGRIRRDIPWNQPSTGRKGRGKIYICGYIPAAHEEHETAAARAKKKGDCTNPLLSKLYVKKQLEALPAENRKALLSWDKHFERFKPKFFADAAADSRSIIDEIQYKGYEAFGVKLKRLKKRAKSAGLLKVALLNLPDSVQTPLPPDFVQTAIGGLYKGNKPSVQTEEAGLDSAVNGKQKQELPSNGTARAFSDLDSDTSTIGRENTTTATPLSEEKAQQQQNGSALQKSPPNYNTFRSLYPPVKLDDRAAFEAFTELPELEKGFCIEGLMDHLLSENWRRSMEDNNGFYIPLASNFIKKREYKFKPRPYSGGPKPDDRENRRARELADRARGSYERAMKGEL